MALPNWQAGFFSPAGFLEGRPRRSSRRAPGTPSVAPELIHKRDLQFDDAHWERPET
jgi:hypothetical protein